MSAIGGFLPLETAHGPATAAYHVRAVPLASGRACWHAVLRACRPNRVRVPFYICDAVLQPLAALAIPFDFYALDAAFRPAADGRTRPGQLTLVVNYFGVQSTFVDARAHDDERVVVDDTQAFFRVGGHDRRSFNSARKFFGVPDGAFLYGVDLDVDALPPSETGDCDHLVTRRAGDDQRAWDLFKQHEARIGIEIRAMSQTSSRLLGTVDMAAVRRRRRANFRVLHARLGPMNTLALPLDDVSSDAAEDVPLCYPFQPAVRLDRGALARAGIYVPTFWPEVVSRPGGGFDREREAAAHLLPLPIDHRYDLDDMDALADTLLQELT